MKAMILAAGKGTRLHPITDNIPKALVEFSGKTLLEIQIHKLMQAGIHDIIINVHHFASQIIQYLIEHKNFGATISLSDESNQLLDTGGGIKKASWFFQDTEAFLVHNVDIISGIELKDFIQNFRKRRADALLAVKNRESSRKLLFDKNMHLRGWLDKKEKKSIPTDVDKKVNNLSEFAFSGIHIIRSSLVKQMPKKDRFSIIKAYLDMAKTNKIAGYDQGSSLWWDIGKYDHFHELRKNKALLELINTKQ
ncbi:MAG: nucleotidyltransferase family protein [Bacteroidales bacterium]|nr:nucleotidyltransferase family protein [Bacteroidales bacterium]MCF8387833.1 nucleotidyltransferase family protein [Bacteroidales bacterium]MCF8396609.1 nucleotidyltransferase family protein [Bacteroidales bacterium]